MVEHSAIVNQVRIINDSGFISRFSHAGDGKLIYIGEAIPNSNTGSAVWRITKLNYGTSAGDDGQLVLLNYAGSSIQHDKVWNDRESYDYF